MATTPVLKTCIVSNFSGMLDVQTDGPQDQKTKQSESEGEVITSGEFVEPIGGKEGQQGGREEAESKKRQQKGGGNQPKCQDCQDAEEGNYIKYSMKFISTNITLIYPGFQQWMRTSTKSVGSATMKKIIKMPGSWV